MDTPLSNEIIEKTNFTLTIIKSKLPDDILDYLQKKILKLKDTQKESEIAKYLLSKLEKKYKPGWNVFIGQHFCGFCTYENGYFVEFMLFDKYRVIIFKSYLPEKA